MKHLKSHVLTLLFFASGLMSFAQVGIGTTSPKSTLDIVGDPATATTLDGIMAPRITADQLAAKTYTADQKSAIVYVDALPTTTLTGVFANITSIGYYFFDGANWQAFAQGGDNLGDHTAIQKLDLASNKLVGNGGTEGISITSTGSIGVGATTPVSSALLDVTSTTQGFLPPRMTEAQMNNIVNPVDGLIIFCKDCSPKELMVYNNPGGWESVAGAPTATVVNDCNINGFEGTYINGIALTAANKFTVTVTNSSFSTATLAFGTGDLVLSGVGGISVSSVSPTSASLIAGQSQLVTYTLINTPTSEGTLTGIWTKLSLSCTKTQTVLNGAATFTTLPDTVTVASVMDGTPVTNIQGVIDNASNQITLNVPYTGGQGSYTAYTSAVVNSNAGTGESDANGFSLSYPAGMFSGSGNIPVTVVVDGDGSFDAKKQLFGATATIATLDFQSNGTSAGNIILDVIGCPTTVSITGAPANACGASVVALISSFSGGDTYAWTADNGATFDDATSATPMLTLPNTDVNVTVSLTTTKASCSPSTLVATPVVIDVDAVATIAVTGPAICLDANPGSADDFTNLAYTVGASTTATSFAWTWVTNPSNLGVINSGATTNTVDVTFNKTLAAVGTYVLQCEMTLACGTTVTRTLTIVLQNVSCNCSTAVVDVVSSTGQTWMDRNLGATRQATSMTDFEAYGCLFQWGRGNDGHADMNWTSSTTGTPVNGTTATLSTTDDPGNSLFITSAADWRSPANNNLWQNGLNDPCPPGYRVPTETELNNERLIFPSNNRAGAFGSALKLPTAGDRLSTNGVLVNVTNYGYHWSSTVSGTNARGLFFYGSGAGMNFYKRALGYSVRCIKD